MLLVKKGFPEEGELLMCTVTNIQYHSVFVGIDEYQKTGLIHISEIAPGRIRNIRDYVEEGKKVICKVLKVDTEKGHIDLSLRRVNEGQKRAKVNEVKQHQKCEKIIEMVARAMKKDLKALFAEVSDNALKKYDTLYSCFEEVTIGGELFLSSYAPDGINIIKESLKKVKEVSDKISVSYLGSGRYQVTVTAPDYKEAEKLLEKSTEDALEYIHDKKGIGDFKREAK